MLMEGNVINEEYFSDFDIVPIKFEGKNLTYLIK
jgi:hypothetical protein